MRHFIQIGILVIISCFIAPMAYTQQVECPTQTGGDVTVEFVFPWAPGSELSLTTIGQHSGGRILGNNGPLLSSSVSMPCTDFQSLEILDVYVRAPDGTIQHMVVSGNDLRAEPIRCERTDGILYCGVAAGGVTNDQFPGSWSRWIN